MDDLQRRRDPDALRAEFRRDQELALALIHAPGREIEFEVCARLGIPSVAVIAEALSVAMPGRREDRAFKIWVGAEVAKVMRKLGYQIVQPRGRVRWGHFFTYSAVWARISTSNSPEGAGQQAFVGSLDRAGQLE